MSATVAASAASHRLECMEIWGGNHATDNAVSVTGIDCWVLSEPYGGDAFGGDMHFVSTCGSGRIARFTLADVAGHGRSVSDVAVNLRRLMRKHINRLDQTRFARDLNKEFGLLTEQGTFATALLASYYAPTDHLIICNAGHPPPLWYRSRLGAWAPLTHSMPERSQEANNLPLGIIEPTTYHQFAVRLEVGDLVLVYSDALIEASNPAGELLGNDGLLEHVGRLDPAHPETFGRALLRTVADYRNNAPAEDDVTLVLLHHNGGNPPGQSIGDMMKVMGKMFGLIKV